LTDSQIVPYIPYGQGFALNGTKSLVKLKTLNVGKFPFSKRTPLRIKVRSDKLWATALIFKWLFLDFVSRATGPTFCKFFRYQRKLRESPVLGSYRMKPDPLLWPVKIPSKPLLIFSTKRRGVGLQHCAFSAVWGVF
ncbi:hypothetical protein, partial [Enterobacter asburiae]|uniref:hypothetical protein n=1 Tax=Enterobacter asburiae TaxID=61645 RepID=UPI0032EDF260